MLDVRCSEYPLVQESILSLLDEDEEDEEEEEEEGEGEGG